MTQQLTKSRTHPQEVRHIIFICTKKDAVINVNTEGLQQGAKHRLRSRTQGHKWDILQWPGQPPDVSLKLYNLQLLIIIILWQGKG